MALSLLEQRGAVPARLSAGAVHAQAEALMGRRNGSEFLRLLTGHKLRSPRIKIVGSIKGSYT